MASDNEGKQHMLRLSASPLPPPSAVSPHGVTLILAPILDQKVRHQEVGDFPGGPVVDSAQAVKHSPKKRVHITTKLNRSLKRL